MRGNTGKSLFIFGFGFTSEAVADRVRDDFDQVFGTTRSPKKADGLTVKGIAPLLFGGDDEATDLSQPLSETTHLLVSIGPNEAGDPVLNAVSDQLRLMKKLQWIGYLSTVGVYGNHDGAWVDETTEPKPVSKRSIQRMAAESAWQDFARQQGLPLAVFRLSGIYGPGRNAFMNIEKGTARRLVKTGQVFNRIHREDIGEAVALAIENCASGIFNITDNEPAPPQDVVTYAHQLAGREPPPEMDFETANLSPMARSFYGENKRVSNAKSKTVLGMTYRWPTYRESLKRMWEEGSWRTRQDSNL